MFGNIILSILFLYLCYYIGMVGFDLHNISKFENGTVEGKAVDISGVTDSYIPINVKELLNEKEDENKSSAEEIEDESLQFEEDEEEDENVGGRKESYIKKIHQEGFTAQKLKEMMIRSSNEPNLFANVKFAN